LEAKAPGAATPWVSQPLYIVTSMTQYNHLISRQFLSTNTSFIILSCSSRCVSKYIIRRNLSSTPLSRTTPVVIISRIQLRPCLHLDVVVPVGSAHCCRSRLAVAIGAQTVIVVAISGCRHDLHPGTLLPPVAVLWPRDPLVASWVLSSRQYLLVTREISEPKGHNLANDGSRIPRAGIQS
jgi:hypothetical protein